MPKNSSQRKKLVLLDAHAIIHRAYHGMPDFTTRAGFPTGAIYGFASMILKIIDDFKPDAIVACYDLPGPTFRHETFEKYKGTRSKTDDALKMQFPATRELCEIFSIPVYDAPGFEADDILGTISQQLKDEAIDIIIASGDMDTLQLVDKKRVQVFTLKRGNDTVLYDEQAVMDRFNFKPLSIIDYKALRGDSSDNIPGIKGIGDKAATLAITEFATVEKMYKILDKDEQKLLDIGLTQRMVNLIREGREDAEFSRVLATIRTDAPIEFVMPQVTWRESIDVEHANELFEKYELRTMKARLEKVLGIVAEVEEKEEEIIDEKELKETAIALWVHDSDQTDADVEKILEYTKAKTFTDAQTAIINELASDTKNQQVFDEIEKPLISVIETMQNNGVLVDQKFFNTLSGEYHQILDGLAKEIHTMAGSEFNIKSPKQLSKVLFEDMGLPTKGIKKSKTGAYSTNIATLEKLHEEHEIIQKIMDYRELEKLVSTYIDVIPKMVGDDKRLHAEFLQNGTVTGRFSSRNPNMQNIPTRTEVGRKIREGFVAEKGYELVSLDYSQIELRVLAMLSGDKKLIEIFKEGQDIHSAVASLIGGVPMDQVDREMRRKAKIVNFGILYGMGVNSLRKQMGGDRAEAQEFHNGFFEQFPDATAFLESSKEHAHKHGFTETLFGRKRQFRNINSKLPFIRAMAERMALNAPIQGTSADMIKLAMVAVDDWLEQENKHPDARLILQIHDEIIYEVKKEFVEDFSKQAEEMMATILENSYLNYDSEVPILVHSSHGKHWGELK